MTDFSDLLLPEAVRENVVAASRKALFQQLAGVAATVYGLGAQDVAERLAAREKLGSTGFGGGVAIPHARIAGLPRIVGVFARLAQGIDYPAIDELPVDLVFVLLSPPEAGADHLKTLARVSRQLRDRGVLAKLRGAGSRDALHAVLTADESRDAG